MKFDELYKRVYLNEQDKEVSAEEAPKEAGNETTEANPEDFKGDVEPMPQPAPEPATEEAAAPSGMTLLDYTNKLDELAELLLNTNGDCLQKLVVSLEKPNTPFQGISGKSAEIVRAAGVLNDLSGRLKMYIISSAKG
jgi:hypothetical protein